MEIICGKIGSGKTQELIKRVRESGEVLVVHSNTLKNDLIVYKILEKDQVITYDELIRLKHFEGTVGKQYYIDNIEFYIERFCGVGCKGFSVTAFDEDIFKCKFLEQDDNKGNNDD